MSPDDPLAGKFFDTGPIPPGGFAEFVISNISPGNYSFYSTNGPSTQRSSNCRAKYLMSWVRERA